MPASDRPIPDRLVEKARTNAARLGAGRHQFFACPTCGTLRYVATTRNDFDGVAVNWELEGCPTCAAAWKAAPEVVDWVLSVLRLRDEAGGGDR